MRYNIILKKIREARVNQPVMALADDTGDVLPGLKGVVIKKSVTKLTVRWNTGRVTEIFSIQMPMFGFARYIGTED
jgi:hypothetical protein